MWVLYEQAWADLRLGVPHCCCLLAVSCSSNFSVFVRDVVCCGSSMCCHTEIQGVDQLCCLTQSQCIITLSPDLSTDPIVSGTWQVATRALILNPFLTVNIKLLVMKGLFCKYFVNVNVILNFKKEMYIPLKLIPKEDSLRH